MWLDLLSSVLQKVLEIVLPALFTIAAGYVIVWFRAKVAQARAKLTDEQNWIVDQIINTAILAAEQARLKDILVNKKEYALNIAEVWLAQKGIKIDLNQIDALIEAAVFNEFNREKAPVSE